MSETERATTLRFTIPTYGQPAQDPAKRRLWLADFERTDVGGKAYVEAVQKAAAGQVVTVNGKVV